MPEADSSDDDRISELESRLDRLERTVAALREAVERLSDEDSSADSTSAPQSDSASFDSSASNGSPSPDVSGDDENKASSPDTTSSDAGEEGASEAAPSPESESESDAAVPDDKPPSSPDDRPSVRQRVQQYATTLGLRSEDWISYVGMGLLLLGLSFLFKYSIEQGWLTPTVRLGFGVGLGTVLLAAGLRRAEDRPLLQQILLGGSSATFYGTVFAAYQLYGLLPYLPAFGSMVLVTVITVVLGLREGYASTAFIGIAGGFGAPFLLYTQADGGMSLALYTCLVVGGACLVYLYRGWRSLLYLALTGGWAVLLMPCVEAAFAQATPSDGWGIQLGLVLAWLLLGGTPVLRAALQIHHPEWGPSDRSSEETGVASWTGRFPTGPVTASPILCFLATRMLWHEVPDLGWAVVAAAVTLLYGGLYALLRRHDLRAYAPVHGLVATVFVTYGASELLGGTSLLLVWAVEAALLPMLARRLDDALLRLSGHVLAGLVLGWLGMRFRWTDPTGHPLVSPEALSELLALGLLTVGLRNTRTQWLNRLYQMLLIGGWFGWWIHNLLPLSHGPSYLLIVSSLSTVGLLLLARWNAGPVPRLAAHATLLILAGTLGLRLPSASTAAVPLLHRPAVGELFVIGALLGGAHFVSPLWQKRGYQGLALTGWLGWTLHELAVLPNGQAYVSALWGGTAVALLLGGAWTRTALVQKGGLAVLALFVGKLFFVDLETLSTLGRIVLFLGTGAGFLVISYLLPGLGTKASNAAEESVQQGPDE